MENQLNQLLEDLREYGKIAIAFSGGVDSSFLLKVAVDALGKDRVLALIADTPTLPRKELAEALALAEQIGVRCLAVRTDELSDEAYLVNPKNRCYLCKKRIFSRLLEVARENGFDRLADGDHADDSDDDRPGYRAVIELGVLRPLREGGWTKRMIRNASRALLLPTAQKPALACLATRIPTGDRITLEKLQRIERAEDALHRLGFPACRVRCHDMLARIELQPEDFGRVMDPVLREKIDQAVRGAGFSFVALDLLGYGGHAPQGSVSR